MAACEDIRLLLGPFDDGELEPHEMEDVAFHVVSCASCKAALDGYRALGVALRDVITAPPLDNFVQMVVARVERVRLPLSVPAENWRDWLRRAGSVFELAGVSAVAAIVTLMIATPGVQRFLAHRDAKSTYVATSPTSDNAGTAARATRVLTASRPALSTVAQHSAASGIVDSGSDLEEMVSELGGARGPSMAVWSEPRSHTTVVWVPEQP